MTDEFPRGATSTTKVGCRSYVHSEPPRRKGSKSQDFLSFCEVRPPSCFLLRYTHPIAKKTAQLWCGCGQFKLRHALLGGNKASCRNSHWVERLKGPWPRVSPASTQKLIALRPSSFVCACCQDGLRYQDKSQKGRGGGTWAQRPVRVGVNSTAPLSS